MEVQRKVYSELGLEEPPAVDIGKQRRKDLMAELATELFSLKPGAVSQVQTEPKNFVIYKVLSREIVPEENLKTHISGQLTQRKFKEAMKSLLDSAPVDLNEGYFGAPTAIESQPRRSPHTIITQ
jgi:parvulin-like peptidyl-prolyl isomerase